MSIVWVADWLGGGWTLFVMALSFISGIFMLRHTGISGLLLAGAAVRSGQNISLYQMLWPIHYTAAAVFLLSPVLFQPPFALLLLIPFKGNAAVSSTAVFQSRQTYSSAKDDEDIIEGEYTVYTHQQSRQTARIYRTQTRLTTSFITGRLN